MMAPLNERFPDDFLLSAAARIRVPESGWSDLFLESSRTMRVEWDSREGWKQTPGLSEGFALRWVEPDRQRQISEEGLRSERILSAGEDRGAPDPPATAESPDSARAVPEEDGARVRALLESLADDLTKGMPWVDRFSLSLHWRIRETCAIAPGRPAARNLHRRAVLTARVASGAHSFAAGVGAGDPDLLRRGNPLARIRAELERRREAQQEGEPAPAGEQVIILAPPTGGVFFHEACGHALEGDLILRRTSPFAVLLGQRVAPDAVSARDDPRRPGLEGSYDWDDEGSAGRETILIDRGVLTGFLTDRITGARLGVGTTGNGRRESFRDPPLPRMSNAFLMAGADDPEEILRSTSSGIFVHSLGGGRVDPGTGDFLFRALSGSRIENGRLTAPLRPFSLSGNGPAALKGIERVGDDLSFGDGTGSCGKDGQQVPVAAGGPTIRLRGILILPG